MAAYDSDPLINPDDFLGEATSDERGTFRIDFDSSKFAGFLAVLEGSPDVYLIMRDAHGKETLRTSVCKTGKEIEYHIKLGDEKPHPDAIDPYAGNARRLLAYLREAGATMGIEHRWNLDVLQNPNFPTDMQDRLRQSTEAFDDNLANFNHLMALLDGVVNRDMEERRLGAIGYDGPQVPHIPRREAHADAIQWSRREGFRWA